MSKELEQFQIFVGGCGWEEELCVTRSTTVADVKKTITELKDLPLSAQLVCNGNMESLQGHRTLGSYDIDGESKIWVVDTEPYIMLCIKMPQLASTFSLKAYNFQPIMFIKDVICDRTGISCDWQNLLHDGKLLSERNIVHHSNIKRINPLIYAIFGVNNYDDTMKLIAVKPNNELLEITVKSQYTLFDVKTVIESTSRIPTCVQQLWFNQKQLKDWKVVSDYPLRNGSIIHLKFTGTRVNLLIQTGNSECRAWLEVMNSDTIDEVIKKIPQNTKDGTIGRIGNRRWIELCLSLDGNMLSGDRMVAFYDIKSRSTLMLELAVSLKVVKPDGTTFEVRTIYSSPEVYAKKVEEICGIPYELLEVTYQVIHVNASSSYL